MAMRLQRSKPSYSIVPDDQAVCTLYPVGFRKDPKAEYDKPPVGRYTLAGLLLPKGRLLEYNNEELLARETKYRNVQVLYNAGTSDAFQFTCLNGLTKGTGQGDRIGNRVVNRALDFRFSINMVSNLISTWYNNPMAARIAVVHDKQPNAAVCPSPFSSFYASCEVIYRDRFIILYDETIMPESHQEMEYWNSSAVEPLEESKNFFRHIRLLMDLPTTYNSGNGGAVGDINTGSLYLILLSKGCNLSGAYYRKMFFDGNCEYRWTDE